MRKLILICLLLFGTISCNLVNKDGGLDTDSISITPTAVATQTPVHLTTNEPPLVTSDYLLSNDFILNPERGFSTEIDFYDPDYSQYYEDGRTLVYANILLDEYTESELPQAFLDELDNWFSSIRNGGIKMIVRFSYNDGPYPFPEADASLDQILLHIQQLTPVLQKNSDVIAWLEAGFIGAWGEWHASTNGLDESDEAKRRILFALLEALPSDRSVLLRYPVDLMKNFPEPLSIENAFNGTNQARVGFHNDCFLASEDDEHTYARDGINTFEEELNYLSDSTQFVPVGGESCAYNPPRSDCSTALMEMEFFHYVEIGDGWHPDVLESWGEQGCYSVIGNRLGYRFSLLESTINEVVLPGGVLNMDIKLTNNGFASLSNPRPVYLVLDGPEYYEVELPVDARLWSPGKITSINFKIRVPFTAPEGKYNLALWLPDSYDSLQSDSRYSIRFANEDIWDNDTAYNIIRNIEISSSTIGDVDSSVEKFYVFE
jgi:hypothetical protein